MRCQTCNEIEEEKNCLINSDRWNWAHDDQVCSLCSPRKYLTYLELEKLLGAKIETN
jgi:hypothetical protein